MKAAGGVGCIYSFRRSMSAKRCISGMCAGNSDTSIDPDVRCAAPSVLSPSASMIAGRDQATCCIRTGTHLLLPLRGPC
jgi:hypothetical protein